MLPVLLPVVAAVAGCSDGGGGGGPWLFGTVALLLVGAGGWAVGGLRERRAADAALRRARRELQLAASLQETWLWDSDEEHRLLRLQPPPAAAAAEWTAADGDALWERFETEVADELRLRLDAHASFDQLRVRRRADGSHWQLRATPRFGDDGRFAGYAGSARPTDEADASRADQLTLQALMAAVDGPVLLATGSAEGWQLRHLNGAAQRLFETGEALPLWSDLLPRLPAPLRNAIAESGTGSADEHEGWRLRRFATATGDALLLVRLPQPDAEAAASDGASFSFAVSHDLRAPVRVVEGFTRILKEDYGRSLDRVGNDHLDRVLGAAARMNQMIDALLTLARLSQQPLARQPVNLSQLAAYVVDDLRRAAPERQAEIQIEPGLAANGDPTLLRLVLENLLGNAWKYTARAKKAHIVFAAEQQAGRRVFVVRDNGAGFDMRSADRLFGLFQRLHSTNDFPGTGVGLASVKRIVRRHGGDVWADAEPGRGAAFHFTLRE